MPNKQDITLDFPGSVTPTQDTVSGGGAPAPSDRNPGLLHPTPGLEWGAPSAYRGLGEQEEPGAPGGEEVPYTQTGPGTVDMSSPARVRSLAMPSPDGPLLPAHKTLLATSSYSTHTPYKIHQNCDIINWFEVVVKNGKCSESEIKEAS